MDASRKCYECNLCGKRLFQVLFQSSDMMHSVKGDYITVKCTGCGLIFINPKPTHAQLRKHYPDKYYSYNIRDLSFKKFQTTLYRLYFSDENRQFIRFLFMILFFPLRRSLRTIRIVRGGKFLDVGCGSGNFLMIAKELGFECYGVEPGCFDKKYAKEHSLKIFNGNLLNARFTADYFDNITFNHVFEHVDDPLKTINESNRILKKGGILQITVPNSRSLAFWMFRKYWVQLDVPRHLFTYSTKILRDYTKKTGLKVMNVRYNSAPFQFTGSLAYIAKTKGYPILERFFNGKICFLMFYPLSSLCNIFGIGDCVEITLTK